MNRISTKNTSEKQENFSKPNIIPEMMSKE